MYMVNDTNSILQLYFVCDKKLKNGGWSSGIILSVAIIALLAAFYSGFSVCRHPIDCFIQTYLLFVASPVESTNFNWVGP